jgi:hypothetical protein
LCQTHWPVEEILARTNPEILQKIYNLPPFASPLEFLTTLALTSGRLLKVVFTSSSLATSPSPFFCHSISNCHYIFS